MLKEQQQMRDRSKLKGLGKSSSQPDLNRDIEEDDRRIHTDPLDAKDKKIYDNKPNPFIKHYDDEFFNNCYAECSKKPKT